MKSVTLYVWCAILVCATTGTATAQDRRYVKISGNVGFQEGSGQLGLDRPLTFFGKSGFFRIDDGLATSLIFDGSATVRVWKDLGLGAGLAQTWTERLGHPYTASVPSPVPGFLNLEVEGLVNLAHGERTVYALASWTTAISNRFDIVVSGGPAFIEVDQDLPVATPVLPPTGIQTLIVSTTRVSESTTGFHATLDFDYVFGQRAGLGALVRYTRGSIDLLDGTQSMTVGGLQFSRGCGVKL